MPRRCRQAFSLIELLVVIAIITMLLGILLPNLSRARAQARTAVCAGNLHSLGVALNTYLEENNGNFFRYYMNTTAADLPGKGRLWWFGFEPNGPGGGTNRPLDKSLSPLARYTANLDRRLLCPDFPYSDPFFFPKFQEHAASYAYNMTLGPISLAQPSTRQMYLKRMDTVVAFADAVHFEVPTQFNEGFYLQYIAGASQPSGYAHFRHNQRAQYVFLDGHVDGQPPLGPEYRHVAGSATGNLYAPDGSAKIYGN